MDARIGNNDSIEKIYTGYLGKFERRFDVDTGRGYLVAMIGKKNRNVAIPSYVGHAGIRFFGWRMERMNAAGTRLPTFLELASTRENQTPEDVALAFADHAKEDATFSMPEAQRSFRLDPNHLTNVVVPWVISIEPGGLDKDWQWSTVEELREYMHSGFFMSVTSVLDRFNSPQTS